jgi:shikimate kinase
MTDATALPPTRVVLLGMMGSGKSSVGVALAKRTGWPFIDNDTLVEQATGHTARRLLATRGQDAMRAAESAALRTGLALPPPAIVATAAGTILDAGDRAQIEHGGFVVWLQANAETLAARAVGAEHRPWLDRDPVGWFLAALEERTPLYAAVADIVIDTGAVRPEEAADAIVATLSAGG